MPAYKAFNGPANQNELFVLDGRKAVNGFANQNLSFERIAETVPPKVQAAKLPRQLVRVTGQRGYPSHRVPVPSGCRLSLPSQPHPHGVSRSVSLESLEEWGVIRVTQSVIPEHVTRVTPGWLASEAPRMLPQPASCKPPHPASDSVCALPVIIFLYSFQHPASPTRSRPSPRQPLASPPGQEPRSFAEGSIPCPQ